MFQLEAVAFQHSRPLLAHGFNLAGALSQQVVKLFGFLGHALVGYAAGRDEDVGMDISRIVAALGCVYGAIGGALVSTYQPQAKRL